MLIPFDNAMAQQGRYGDWHMGPGMMGSGWGLGWFGMIFTLGFWVLVAVCLILLSKWLFQKTSGRKEIPYASNRALEILKERYAKGEIDKTEFEIKKKDLQD